MAADFYQATVSIEPGGNCRAFSNLMLEVRQPGESLLLRFAGTIKLLRPFQIQGKNRQVLPLDGRNVNKFMDKFATAT